MDRDVIVEKVVSKLIAMGVTEATARKETDRLFARLGDADLSKICTGGEDAGAEKLAHALHDIAAPAEPELVPEETASEPDEADDMQLQIDLLQEVFYTDQVIPPDYDFSAAADEDEDYSKNGAETLRADPTASVPTAEELLPEAGTHEQRIPATGNRLVRWVQSIHIPESGRERGIFIACSVVAIPAALVLVLLVAVLFGVAFAAAFLLVGVFIAAMAAVVAGGTAIALVGLIYGTIELFASVPIGLYEIGIGVAALGVTMLGGILLYNAAIRLVPFAIRKLAALARYTARQLKDLLIAMKGVFSKR